MDGDFELYSSRSLHESNFIALTLTVPEKQS